VVAKVPPEGDLEPPERVKVRVTNSVPAETFDKTAPSENHGLLDHGVRARVVDAAMPTFTFCRVVDPKLAIGEGVCGHLPTNPDDWRSNDAPLMAQGENSREQIELQFAGLDNPFQPDEWEL
jgi:hypothetical protein